MIMNRLTENKIVLIKRKTRLDDLVSRFNTINQAKFYIEHLGSDFSDYIREDRQYKNSVIEACEVLGGIARVQVVDREYLPSFIFGGNDLVIAIGQDGLVANTLKYLDNQMLIGVNPDPSRWDGVLLPFRVSDLGLIVPEVFKLKRSCKDITMAKANLNDGQSIYGVNDLFIGQKTHVSSRYILESGGKQEPQSSSGIIISTGLGSTGWLRSVLTGAANIISTVSGNPVNIKEISKFDWDADYLYYSVREPFPSRTTKADLVFGRITRASKLKIHSLMSESGVIFSDGIETDFLQFNSGITAEVTIAEKKGHLVV